MAEFKDRLRELRIEKGLTQQELGDAIGLHGMSISGYERGVKKPSFKALDDLADALDASFDYLLGNSDNNTGYPRYHLLQDAIDSPNAKDKLRLIAYRNSIPDLIAQAYKKASPDTQAAVRAILHVQEEPDGDS